MTNPIVKEHNTETNEVMERPMTKEEVTAWKADAALEQSAQEKKIELEAAKTLAEAKLAALGLTSDDLKALGL
jgi:hypothetical protein